MKLSFPFEPQRDANATTIGGKKDRHKTVDAQLLRVIAKNVLVTISPGSLKATDTKTGEVFIVVGDDPLDMAVKLAEKVGLDLMDG